MEDNAPKTRVATPGQGSPEDPVASRQSVRILRLIARMNLGGPALHVNLLSSRLDARRFETLLVRGRTGQGEESLDSPPPEPPHWQIRALPSLGSAVHPWRDLVSLVELIRIARRFKPHVVHTHTAKAGMLGRLAALCCLSPRPVIVHTFHGHVLRGYFGPVLTGFYRAVERSLARISDRLVCVSANNMEELVGLGVGRRKQYQVIPVGLDLDALTPSDGNTERLRCELSISGSDVIATFVGRLVQVKRVDRLLHAIARARTAGAPLHLVVVGDGELRSRLETLARSLGIDAVTHFLGYRAEVGGIVAASDLAVLSSDNEGTPVSLIHAGAVGVPSVATAVGGVSEVVLQDGGLLVDRDDLEGFANGLRRLAEDSPLREALGRRAREHVWARFTVERLVGDIESLYEELLANRQLSLDRGPSLP